MEIFDRRRLAKWRQISWFPYFIETGENSTTRKTWFAIGQSGGHDAGWRQHLDGTQDIFEGLTHPHGGRALPDGPYAVHRGVATVHRLRRLSQHRSRLQLGARCRWRSRCRLGFAQKGLRDVGLGMCQLWA